MTSNPIHLFESLDQNSGELVGGKGMNLGLMTRAGLPVPPGFCISSDAYREALTQATQGSSLRIDGALRAAIVEAYHHMGSPTVAVRSSATMEDGAEASFAGQQETILGVVGDDALIDAILRCWRSLHTERAVAYRRKQGIDDSLVAMAVVVQLLVESQVSGVLFTRDPLDPQGQRMMIEAARGLGESVVSGSVMPDRFHTDRHTGQVIEQEIHTQATMHTKHGIQDVEESLRDMACLSPAQIVELTRIGREIESYYGESRDVEWAWANDQVYVLQARPITTAMASDVEAVRQEEMEKLRQRADQRGTVWARYNLAEVLAEPTPMTWSIVRQFMSGRGGFGAMYRLLGFDPDPALDCEGFIDLICGRPYVNLSREPLLYFRDFPYGHDFAAIKRDPALAIYPTPAVDRRRATMRTWWRLPAIFLRMWLAGRRMKKMAKVQAARLRDVIYPAFAATVTAARVLDLTQYSEQALLAMLHEWIECTLVEFAAQSLAPSMFAATALVEVQDALTPILGDVVARGEAQALMAGVHAVEECDLPRSLTQLTSGKLSRQDFLARFGHRGPNEMELASPRWSEDQSTLPAIATGMHKSMSHGPAADWRQRWNLLADALMLDAGERRKIEASITQARTYLALREESKHHLIMGMAIMRSVLLELDRQLALSGGIFHLEIDELAPLIKEKDVASTRSKIDTRRKRRKLALGLEVPQVLFSDDLDAIGRAVHIDGAAQVKGTAVSFGVYDGDALVLDSPVAADSVAEGFVLVCPSTDPSWVPLFLKAKALVMETGGVLSHGAIVAREFGIPAVAGISDARRRFRSGQRLRVDGTTGVVHLFD